MNVSLVIHHAVRDIRDVCASQVASMETASAAEAPALAPVVSFDSFRSLCDTPPLQVGLVCTWACSLPSRM